MGEYLRHESWPGMLASIRANPGDNLPRLVAADLIQECGDEEKANLIRSHCAFTETPPTNHNLLLPDGFDWDADPNGEFGTWYAASDPVVISVRLDRGFVTEVQCLGDVWWGRRCDRCGGEGYRSLATRRRTRTRVAADPVMTQCGECKGIGRLVGYGPMICSSQPVSQITLAGSRPFLNPLDNVYEWERDIANNGEGEAVIPAYVFQHLAEGVLNENHDGGDVGDPVPTFRAYQSLELATADLSHAGISWANGHADHPPRV